MTTAPPLVTPAAATAQESKKKGSGTFSADSGTSLGVNRVADIAAPRATGAEKVPDPVASRPLILMGDFNAAEAGPIIAALRARYREVLCDGPDADAPRPPRRDYLFVSPSIEIVTACLVENDASDHPALLAVLRVPPSNE